MRCTEYDPDERPTMKEVVEELAEIQAEYVALARNLPKASPYTWEDIAHLADVVRPLQKMHCS